jgi:hypothetical protein
MPRSISLRRGLVVMGPAVEPDDLTVAGERDGGDAQQRAQLLHRPLDTAAGEAVPQRRAHEADRVQRVEGDLGGSRSQVPPPQERHSFTASSAAETAVPGS